uniref:Uncharacterized protein n=1 Tax=Chromera velia CCMP2878 TaxID=1169474 RepID=A0A0G4I5E7_9ALVE|eukprot:Cvel_11080.t1-p1 / transcript=Cvel_11080.t1 / gene=Cvel_11080 / organism=Chromera_velia_CCMP2878 / gene_product=Ankyrin repeat domain-containing protein 29, putative / transcript_product=Ankyrin repeat domain-containing protein 29, putative / location=Cvel_scaffold685:7274-10519(+) / protein_length=588 / sequence_SO=supercontig / SO=protein_coding / is_pseudo=false
MSRFHLPETPDEFEIRCNQLHEQMRVMMEREVQASDYYSGDALSSSAHSKYQGPEALFQADGLDSSRDGSTAPTHKNFSDARTESTSPGGVGSPASTAWKRQASSSQISLPSASSPSGPSEGSSRPELPKLTLPGIISKEEGRRPYASLPFVRSVPEADLLKAAEMGDVQVIKTAVFSGTNPDATDATGSTALHIASKAGREEIVVLLLSHRASAHKSNKEGRTALHLASLRGHERIVVLLLKAGADPNARTKFGSAALHWAAARGHLGVVRALLGHGAKVDVPTCENEGTALLSAAFCGHLPVVRVLLSHGARICATNGKGMTALHLAASRGHDKVVAELVNTCERSSGLLAVSPGRLPLLSPSPSSSSGGEGRTEELDVTWSFVNAVDRVGETALHKAAAAGSEEAARVLMEAGADPYTVSAAGQSPLAVATVLGEDKVAAVIRALTPPGLPKGNTRMSSTTAATASTSPPASLSVAASKANEAGKGKESTAGLPPNSSSLASKNEKGVSSLEGERGGATEEEEGEDNDSATWLEIATDAGAHSDCGGMGRESPVRASSQDPPQQQPSKAPLRLPLGLSLNLSCRR